MSTPTDLLGRLCQGPKQLGDLGQGAPLVTLALHCIMMNEGFKIALSSGQQRTKGLPVDWNTKYIDEWIFEYTRKGCASVFILHCSLQATSGKMFVQARETGSPSNFHNLGLQLGKYISDPSKCKSNTWQGVIDQEEVLADMMREYIAEPLARNATPAAKAATTLERCQRWLEGSLEAITPEQENLDPREWPASAYLGLTAVTLGGICFYLYRHRPPQRAEI